MKRVVGGSFAPADRDGNSSRVGFRTDTCAATAGKNTGTMPVRAHGSVPVSDPLNTSDLQPLTSGQVVREIQHIVLRFPIKEMAEDQGATPRAVESQRNGDSAMSLRAAVNMCRANPRARAMFARLIGIPGQCSDPDFMEGLQKVVDYYMRQQLPDRSAGDGDGHAQDLFGDLR